MFALEVSQLVKVYRNGRKALNDFSLTFFKSEIVGLLGVNGSGKTTCSTILAGLHPPTSGEIILNGKPVTNNISHYRARIGYCPQRPTLHESLTVKENIYFGGLYFGMSPKESLIKTNELIKQFDLTKYASCKPDVLSGGYKQRVMIARTLIHDPQFIIFDEPTVGLDPSIRKKLWNIILYLKKMGKSILLTTHYIDEADLLCDRICILDEGKILKIATKHALKEEHKQKDLEEIFLKLTEEETS